MYSDSTDQIKPREYAVLRVRRRLGTFTNALFDRWIDWRLGVSTMGYLNVVANAGLIETCHDYWPISYRAFGAAMKYLHLKPGIDVFIDYGAGKGRVAIVAAMYPFRQVIGIEVVEPLVISARDNLARVAHKKRCHNTEIIHCDATRYQLPDDATVIHFYNPFRGEVLVRVMDEIERSYLAAPRDLTILFANPEHFESALQVRRWQMTREDVVWPGSPSPGADSNRYRIYRLITVCK